MMKFKPGQTVYYVHDWYGKPELHAAKVLKVTVRTAKITHHQPGVFCDAMKSDLRGRVHTTPKAAWKAYVNKTQAQISTLESQLRTLYEKMEKARSHV